MTERAFRLILGVALLAALYAESVGAVRVLIGLLLFEGVTGWRMPLLVARLRGNAGSIGSAPVRADWRVNFHAERMLRLVIVLFLVLSFAVWPDALWFLPWFVGIVLAGAGITNICPMAMTLEWLGFKVEAN